MKQYSHIITRIVTEKSALMQTKQVYMFEVAVTATKHQISEAIRLLYGQKPQGVRIVQRMGKQKRVGKLRQEMHMPTRKIAYVTLAKPIEELSKSV